MMGIGTYDRPARHPTSSSAGAGNFTAARPRRPHPANRSCARRCSAAGPGNGAAVRPAAPGTGVPA